MMELDITGLRLKDEGSGFRVLGYYPPYSGESNGEEHGKKGNRLYVGLYRVDTKICMTLSTACPEKGCTVV